MPIKFQCPHCHKALNVRDALAGKRAACPACKKALTIPAPTAAPLDVEALAASALADEPPGQQARSTATIDFTCPFCDEALHMSPAFGGKQAPCPECRRIIKVPLPAVKDPANWRAVENRGPTGARRDEDPAPEGVWGSAVKAAVSREALEEAGALRQVRTPLTRGQKIRRWALAVGGLAVLVIGFLVVRKLLMRTLDQQALESALQSFETTSQIQRQPMAAGEVFRAAGAYHLAAGDPAKALEFLTKARAAVRADATSLFDRDLVLTDVALSYVDLGGSKEEIAQKKRLSWDDVAGELQRTITALRERPEARLDAMRQLCLKLVAHRQPDIAFNLVRYNDQMDPSPKPTDKTKKPRLAALFWALYDPAQAGKLLPAPRGKEATDLATRFFHQSGGAKQAKGPRPTLEDARKFFASAKDPAPYCLDCLLTVAVVASAQSQTDVANACLKDALERIAKAAKDKLSPWQVMPWARLAAELNQSAAAKTLSGVFAKEAPALAARLQLEKFLRELKQNDEPAADRWSQAVPDAATLSHGRALEEFARHTARRGAGAEMMQKLESIKPDSLRPLGYIGIALGAQAAEQ